MIGDNYAESSHPSLMASLDYYIFAPNHWLFKSLGVIEDALQYQLLKRNKSNINKDKIKMWDITN